MAQFNLRYYDNETGYSDGGIETELLQIVKSTDDYEMILRQDNRWSVFYHLSPLRENIFSWYPFESDATLLEIGSGCGALTGLFCQKVKEVKSVELTKARGEINYERNKKYDNLEIIIGNFHKILFEEKFDYIILNGVLEYAGSFTKSQNPYTDFLREIKKLLKPKGILLIAIENRLGIKYFNGAVEDHTAHLFSGVNNYKDTGAVRTFSKRELKNVLEAAEFSHYKFYYPVPDYKFPEVIYSDDSLNLINSNIRNNVYNANRLMFYNENEVMETLSNEGVIDRFLNSFLVETSPEEIVNKESDVIYTKFGNDRKNKFKISTKINRDKKGLLKVEKIPMTSVAQKHLDKMLTYYEKNKNIESNFRYVPVKKEKKSVQVAFIEGKTLEKVLVTYLQNGQKNDFETSVCAFSSNLMKDSILKDDYRDEGFIEVFGKAVLEQMVCCKKECNIDMIFSNIIVDDDKNKNIIIDYEWNFDFWVPQEFVLWRSLYYLYLGNEIVKKNYSLKELLQIVDIDENMHNVFQKWDLNFGNIFVRDSINERFEKNTINVDKLLDDLLKSTEMLSSIYIDFGEGFNERDRIEYPIIIDAEGSFNLSFNLKPFADKRVNALRWDPVESPCKIQALSIDHPINDLEIIPLNQTYTNEDGIFFLTGDPSYGIYGDYEKLDNIHISGKIEVFSIDEVMNTAQVLKGKIAEQEESLHNIILELESQKNKTQRYENMFREISNSNVWKATLPIRKIIDKVK